MRTHGIHELQGSWYVTSYELVNRAGQVVRDLGRADWADWDSSGDLLLARAGRIYRTTVGSDNHLDLYAAERELIDLSDLVFEAREPVPEAERWAGPRPLGTRIAFDGPKSACTRPGTRASCADSKQRDWSLRSSLATEFRALISGTRLVASNQAGVLFSPGLARIGRLFGSFRKGRNSSNRSGTNRPRSCLRNQHRRALSARSRAFRLAVSTWRPCRPEKRRWSRTFICTLTRIHPGLCFSTNTRISSKCCERVACCRRSHRQGKE